MQPWHRWREPLAVVLLIALGLLLALRGLALGLAIVAGNGGGLLGSIPGGDDLLVLVTAAAVLWCATPVAATGSEPLPSAHAWPIALAGVVIVGLTVLGWLVLSVWNVVALARWPSPDVGLALLVIEGLLRLVVPAAALLAVISAVRRAAASRRSAADSEPPALPTSVSEPTDEQPDTPAPERLPAAWQAAEAAGAVWLTADDAAQGRPGLSWTDSGEPAGPVTSGWATPAPPRPTGESPAGEWSTGVSSAGESGDGAGADIPASPMPPEVQGFPELPGFPEVPGPPGSGTAPAPPRPAAEDDDLR